MCWRTDCLYVEEALFFMSIVLGKSQYHVNLILPQPLRATKAQRNIHDNLSQSLHSSTGSFIKHGLQVSECQEK